MIKTQVYLSFPILISYIILHISQNVNREKEREKRKERKSKPTLLVTEGSCLATDMRWPRRVLVRRSLSRTLVARVNS